MEFPALPFFTDAYMLDCGHLSDAEHGRYLLVLILIWQTPKCRIPNDPEWIARKLKRSPAQYAELIEPLIKEFCESDGNFITQKRLLHEYNYLKKQRRQRTDAAKSRWGNEKSDASAPFSHGTSHRSRNAPHPTSPINRSPLPPKGGFRKRIRRGKEGNGQNESRVTDEQRQLLEKHQALARSKHH